MQFKRIQLENWRNFSRVDVALQTRTFLVGANASGKSNFLDVFRFLRDLVLPGGGFQEAVARRGGVSSIRNLAARNQTNVIIQVDVGESEEKIWHDGALILNRPNIEDQSDVARLTQTYLEQTFANREFRDIADFFQSVRYSHLVPQLVRDPERSLGRQADPYGGDFLEQIAGVAKRTQEARLRRISNALKIAIPQLSELKLDRDKKGTPICAVNTPIGAHKGHGKPKMSSPMAHYV